MSFPFMRLNICLILLMTLGKLMLLLVMAFIESRLYFYIVICLTTCFTYLSLSMGIEVTIRAVLHIWDLMITRVLLSILYRVRQIYGNIISF